MPIERHFDDTGIFRRFSFSASDPEGMKEILREFSEANNAFLRKAAEADGVQDARQHAQAGDIEAAIAEAFRAGMKQQRKDIEPFERFALVGRKTSRAGRAANRKRYPPEEARRRDAAIRETFMSVQAAMVGEKKSTLVDETLRRLKPQFKHISRRTIRRALQS